ncbi:MULTISPECIES: EsaB/YukD family protein [Butyrivibrio]|uniref:WXG100 protein secretion system protein n=1 Tax=Butyrivibrio hungatei TaxID=185008 RepID=A0A1D9P318_9FIRM|nr:MULTISPECIES: EsaB/YukD family protein [Butyrivibrio]AOZ96909.1 WXG100 protein secretion system protein [Butyrivibrio hungatei]
MDEKVIVMLKKDENDPGVDIEIPLNISANELIYGLNMSFKLGINMDDPRECFLRASNPITLLKGEKTLEEHGIRNGTSIYTGR